MKTIIHVNEHKIKYNSKNDDQKEVLTCKTYKSNMYSNSVDIVHGGVVVGTFTYSPDKPLPCGAKVWFETQCEVINKSEEV